MSGRRAILPAVIAIAVIGIGGYLVYDQVLRGDDAPPLTLPTASPTGGAVATPGATTEPSGGATDAPATNAPSTDSVAGAWVVGDGSLAGYRVREQLANVSAESDAVGRTTDVTGSITVVDAGDGAQVTEGSIAVDTTTIASDEDMRDNRMRREGLQTDTFPTATFTLTAPVDIPASAIAGEIADVTLVGDLTLHGVTRNVSIDAQAQRQGDTIQVAGSITFPLADFDIVAPNVGGFILSIADEGTLEFLFVLTRG
jgi:polyisoprenoid-binding protein YceI